mmetsp:Transcript_3444/g.21579  ORF Transcript_3444/g.21579 Transcript_3444/m.21579 type:complete len:205 (+) Transcript_3444:1786-2400(+)
MQHPFFGSDRTRMHVRPRPFRLAVGASLLRVVRCCRTCRCNRRKGGPSSCRSRLGTFRVHRRHVADLVAMREARVRRTRRLSHLESKRRRRRQSRAVPRRTTRRAAARTCPPEEETTLGSDQSGHRGTTSRESGGAMSVLRDLQRLHDARLGRGTTEHVQETTSRRPVPTNRKSKSAPACTKGRRDESTQQVRLSEQSGVLLRR